jgi:hypothetical protein
MTLFQTHSVTVRQLATIARSRFCILCCTLTVMLFASGCGTPGFPRQSYDSKAQIRKLEKRFDVPTLVKTYYDLDDTVSETTRKRKRNEIISDQLALVNLNYNQFVAQFSVTKESLDFGTEVTQLGLNLATTAVGSAGTKTVLAAIASGVTGTKLAIDKNFFFEKTVPVLITTMNAQRKVALVPILAGMTNTTDAYPLAQALTDLDSYYFAGTFVGALQAIQADAGAKEQRAEFKITQMRGLDWTAAPVQTRVEVLLERIAKLDDAAAIALEKAPPGEKNPEVDKAISIRDPHNVAATNGKAARDLLQYRVINGSRTEAELTAWETALKPH